MTGTRGLGVGAALAAVAATALGACAAPESGREPLLAGAGMEVEGADAASTFASIAREALATEADVDIADDQQEILRRALETGEVSFEDYREAQAATFACFDAAGIRWEASEPELIDGILRVDYLFEAPASGSPQADACIARHSDVVDTLYVIQPASVEAADAAFEATRDQAVACLAEHGHPVAASAARAEITQVYLRALEADMETFGDAAPPPVAECNDLI